MGQRRRGEGVRAQKSMQQSPPTPPPPRLVACEAADPRIRAPLGCHCSQPLFLRRLPFSGHSALARPPPAPSMYFVCHVSLLFCFWGGGRGG